MILRNFISLRAFTVYMENSLRFEICTEVSFTTPEVMWTLIMKLPHTEVKFYPEVKSQTSLSSLRVSCKRALTECLCNFPLIDVCMHLVSNFTCTHIIFKRVYALFVCYYYFFNTALSKSAFSTYYFGELVFLCHEIWNRCHIYRITA